MFIPLSKLFRPTTFSELMGQELSRSIISAAVSMSRVSNCYLFFGPRGTGKTSLARIFAKTLNCNSRSNEQEPCNSCDSCVGVDNGSSMYVVEMDAASNRGVEDIRKLCLSTVYVTGDSYKVFIIDEAHMLTKEAFNALLKTIEEPSKRVVFVLITTEKEKIPISVVSRSQLIPFRQLEAPILIKKLRLILEHEHIVCGEDVLMFIARFSEGCVRDAESILEQYVLLSKIYNDVSLATLQHHLGVPNTSLFVELDNLTLIGGEDSLKKAMLITRDVVFCHNYDAFFSEALFYYQEQMKCKIGLMCCAFSSDFQMRMGEIRSIQFYANLFKELYLFLDVIKRNGLGEVLLNMFLINLTLNKFDSNGLDVFVERAPGAINDASCNNIPASEYVQLDNNDLESSVVDNALSDTAINRKDVESNNPTCVKLHPAMHTINMNVRANLMAQVLESIASDSFEVLRE